MSKIIVATPNGQEIRDMTTSEQAEHDALMTEINNKKVSRKLERIKKSYIEALELYISNYDRIFTDIEIFTYLNSYFNFSKFVFEKFDPTTEKGTIYDTIKNNIKHDKIRFNHTFIRK